MSTYEVHLTSWRPGLSDRELADRADRVRRRAGVHARRNAFRSPNTRFGGSWGYQVTSYYAPTSRLGTPDDFRYLVDRLHQAGIGVIVDWVPAHFPKDAWALGRFDGTPLYEHSDPRRGEQLPTGAHTCSTSVVPCAATSWWPTRCTGCRSSTSTDCGWTPSRRCSTSTTRAPDGWTPNIYRGRENLEPCSSSRKSNATVHKATPGIVTVAEESTSWPGAHACDEPWRPWLFDEVEHGHDFSENFVSPISHDEVVHGKGTCGVACRETTTSRPPDYAACWRTSGRTQASSCCSWGRSSASVPSGRGARSRLVPARETASPTACCGWSTT